MILLSTTDKSELIALLRKLVHLTLSPRLPPADRANVMEQFAWMDAQRSVMTVGARLETVPELRLTRVVIEAAFNEDAR